MAESSEARVAVRSYVTKHFPGARVSDGSDQSVHWWRVTTPADDVLLHISIEFLRGHSAAQIGERLDQWHVADALKAAAPERLVLVTGDGLRDKPWSRDSR
jgi:hypothetical protein